jgi:hypothetical protein
LRFFFFSECTRRRCAWVRSSPFSRWFAFFRRLRRFLRASVSGAGGAARSVITMVTTLATMPRRMMRSVVNDLISVSNREASIASPALPFRARTV